MKKKMFCIAVFCGCKLLTGCPARDEQSVDVSRILEEMQRSDPATDETESDSFKNTSTTSGNGESEKSSEPESIYPQVPQTTTVPTSKSSVTTTDVTTAEPKTTSGTTKEQTTYPLALRTESSTKASTTATSAAASTAAQATSGTTQSSGSGNKPKPLGTISTFTTLGGHLSDWFD